MLTIFESFDITHLIILSSVLMALMILRFTLRKLLVKRFDKKQSRLITNWVVVYLFILFLLSYYGEHYWMVNSFISFSSIHVTMNIIIIAFLIISLAYHLSRFVTELFMPTIYQRYQLDQGIQFTFNRIFHYIIMIIAVMMSISIVGISLGALTVFASVAGVGIGFGLQNVASNFISGIILLFERPIKIGDRVIVDDIIGDVEQINMRATVIRSVNNEHIIVPNSYFLEEHVINRSFQNPIMRLTVPIGVSYQANPEQVRDLLLRVAQEEVEENKAVLLEPEPFVNFVGFGDSSLDFELLIWVNDSRELLRAKTNLNFKIHRLLTEHDIEIPFPQRDLHLRSIDQTITQVLNRTTPENKK
ncbi:mechanosensitive ion channel family protein [Amphibacillus jilinensis]|uniref:mechanosensitive ion channel family protein n=1 Tax=Amphibacillus jilinensis TaxID=1216008 RepID=UPI0002D5E10A|nr:mechanosensitive ion channel domain-containing protein [Amphibacillus jilinensis]